MHPANLRISPKKGYKIASPGGKLLHGCIYERSFPPELVLLLHFLVIVFEKVKITGSDYNGLAHSSAIIAIWCTDRLRTTLHNSPNSLRTAIGRNQYGLRIHHYDDKLGQLRWLLIGS